MSTVVCPECTLENPSYKQRCEVCYKHLHNQEWRCQSNDCQYLNPVSESKCSRCKKSRNESVGKGKRSQSADRLARDKVDDKHRRPRSADNRLASRWKCCQCNHSNSVDEDVCGKCHHMKAPCCNAGKRWKCHACDNLTSEHLTTCSTCSKKRKERVLAKPAKDLDKGKIEPVDKHSNDHDRKSPSPVRPQSKPLRHDRRQSVRAKNLRTIKTRLVEAEWAKIVLNCKQDKINFTDKEFPPTDYSLFKNPPPGCSNIKWLRLKDVKDVEGRGPIDWKVYDKPTANDIMQGEIGNCWFICALAVVAERQKLVERIVVTKDYCPEGAYVVRLCKDGIWKTVVLDDHFPVDQYKRLKYSKARRGQLWVPLIEKAAAKMHGCYQALGSGRTVESLSLLTGEPCEHLSLNDNKDFSKTIDNMLIWSRLTHARDCRYLMCTSCETKDGFTQDYCKSLGLITGHAYSLLDVYDMDTGEKLLKIRNPWGSESWKGDWSDSSPKWQKVKPEVKQRLKPDGNKHGIFWIEFKDFRKHFGDVDICKTRDWFETRIKGSFPSSADGPWKFVKVYVQNKTDLCLGLHQKNKRGSSSNDDFVDMLIVAMEIVDGKKLRTVGHRGEYTIACLAFKHLDGGKHGSHVQRDFVLTIHSTQNIVVEENDSVTAGYKHFLADTLIQLAVDKGKQKSLKESKANTYSLALDGIILIVENKDVKEYLSIQEDCRNSRNLMSTRGSMFTKDVIPPGHRQLIFLLTRIDNRAGYGYQSSSSYISSGAQSLEHYGDITKKHIPEILRELECLHIPRPI
ncbi:CAPN15 [Mytilus edulis]|uniref:CAPN15 n=1 Tax=Mytilus edulis TaxID=6550 RepID=A0A8S3VB45_MYTED|nr:CAPN15 [Mytilus edulis]